MGMVSCILNASKAGKETAMSRTIIDIQDDLLKKAQKLTGISKKVEIVNYALKRLLEQKEIERFLELRGRVKWEGDLEDMRKDRRGSR
jgi:Arc/MetJ family transcription regulator